ncbi:hypothetical protein DEU56DRAFT_932250 [Suillus clintonianus]|uniref:uncharacterized protein n=1 Tax=Suillus clintonianus TaxID=1904413 RepID=UPI001B88558F|nr:uncharacterized protein DEU56DRAFT_932250 [Suillus clintonianus]KAG2146336.1 hypothetical protein DEU56DRAFT_932250 [Suillus clintonianus]
MPKNQKSSATSGTRKKNARKAAVGVLPPEVLVVPKQKKQKGQKKEPRKKVYIQPSKPSPPQPDPLDTLGLIHRLPPELVMILRSLGKKDPVTKGRALEEIQSKWIDESSRKGDESVECDALVTMLPVWFHRAPVFFTHPVRRIRLLAATLHFSYLRIPAVRDAATFFLRETATSEQIEALMGTWCMVAHDVDRQVSLQGRKSWSSIVSPGVDGEILVNSEIMASIMDFLQRTLLDPSGVHLNLNPAAPVAAPTPGIKKPAGRFIPVAPREEPESNKADEESDIDRNARLRFGALSAVRWLLDARLASKIMSLDDLSGLLSNPLFWTSLYCGENAPWIPDPEIQGLGHGQPQVRQATWALLSALLQRYKGGAIEPYITILSVALLRSAWVETDPGVRNTLFQPILIFLKEFPNAWILEAAYEPDKHGDDDDSDSDGEERETQKSSTRKEQSSQAYREFLQFLELGCAGSPVDGYPTVLVVVSTIPSSVSSSRTGMPLDDFFTSFWAAIDGHALSSLERKVPSASFLSSLLECLVFFLRRLLSGSHDHSVLSGSVLDGIEPNNTHPRDVADGLIRSQFTRVWEELKSRRLRTDENDAGKLIASSLLSLYRMDVDLFKTAWDTVSSAVLSQEDESLALTPTVLRTFVDTFETKGLPAEVTRTLISNYVQETVGKCETVLASEAISAGLSKNIGVVITVMETFGSHLFQHSDFAVRMDNMFINHALRILQASPQAISTFMSRRNDEDRCLELWHVLLVDISQQIDALSSLLDVISTDICPKYLRPEDGELDGVIEHLFIEVLNGDVPASRSDLVKRLIQVQNFILSENGQDILFQTLVSSLSSTVDDILYTTNTPFTGLATAIEFMRIMLSANSELTSDSLTSVLPNAFIVGYLLPVTFPTLETPIIDTARGVWDLWVSKADIGLQSVLSGLVTERLKDLLQDCSTCTRPEDILTAIGHKPKGTDITPLADVFPTPGEFNTMINSLPSDPPDPSLAFIESIIPATSEFENPTISGLEFDSRGYSPYIRVTAALLAYLGDNRSIAKESMWALRHILALGQYANDLLRVPATPSGLFRPDVSPSELRRLLGKVHQLSTYLLSTGDDGLHNQVVSACTSTRAIPSSDGLVSFVVDVVNHAKRGDTVRDALLLRSVLKHLFASASKSDSDQWMNLARRLEKTAPQTTVAILTSITEFAPEPSRMDRYRNEIASDILGIPASRANTAGVVLLRRLAATAPLSESDVVFLPQQRAVNIVKACQAWVSSDEDIDEEVESMMTLLFIHLSPILQSVAGNHWEFIFDVVENNLENCSFADSATLTMLGRSLRLILAVQDLVLTNKPLRASWDERKESILALVKNLVSARLDNADRSEPRSLCRELALAVIQELPDTLVDEKTLPEMCHLLTDPSYEVQRMGYTLLHKAARKRTEHFVIESAVDTEDTVSAELPAELLAILQLNLPLAEGFCDSESDTVEIDLSELYKVSGYLLAWMIMFDLFIDASIKVRSQYFNQMRSVGIIANFFIPNVFDVLGLFSGKKKAFKLDIWAVDDFFIDHFEPESVLGLRLLAAHIYHRALLTVPASIRTWISDCSDRQLLSRVVDYTASYFSPGIIRAELAQVRQADPSSELNTTENLTIKVSPNAGEVTASYTVDDQVLELSLRLPNDWPLHRLDIRDTKMVGVSEDRWRGWVLGVQQIVWQQNGRIVDGLTLFTKNVSLHFAGQVDCAICYSIISVMDSSLPQKPCKTCKNRFHASCLYKWFKSSHSSSCPLCRSDIL